ncbi:uncharacterized protein LOC142343003 [Convolutriloba macropyga]|uniref:uncharacterized protein LOC142343003 n=1 Tax=Convolutriloba macropyga TaxID=536237 RepID=UPI003F5236C1
MKFSGSFLKVIKVQQLISKNISKKCLSMSDLSSFYLRKHNGYRGNHDRVNKNNHFDDDVEIGDVTARYETEPYHKQQLVEEWLLKSQSAEGPKSVSDYNSFREQQEVEKRQKVIKWPSIYTTDNIDKYHSQLETIEFRGQGHSFVQDVNEAESFENWKQTVARKKEVAKQQQVVEQTRFAKAYGRRNNSTIISEKQNQEKKEKGQSSRDFEKWQEFVKIFKQQQSDHEKILLPKIESQSIIVAQETEEEEVAKSVPEYRPRSEGQRKEKADDDKEQEYQKWLLESNRARNFLSQHANLGSELSEVNNAPTSDEETVFQTRNLIDDDNDSVSTENGQPSSIDFETLRDKQYSLVPGVESSSNEEQLIFEQHLRMKQADERSKQATIMRLGANYEHRGLKERLAEGTKSRKPRKIKFEGEIDRNKAGSKPPVSKISGIRNLREIEHLQPIEEKSRSSSMSRKSTKVSSQFPVAKEDLIDPRFKRPLRKSNRSIDSNSNRSDLTFISDGVFLPNDHMNISSK